MPVDLLISGGLVVTLDAQRRVIEDGAVAIDADRIVAVGPRAEIEPAASARRVLDARRRVVRPGYVDAHVHVTASLGTLNRPTSGRLASTSARPQT